MGGKNVDIENCAQLFQLSTTAYNVFTLCSRLTLTPPASGGGGGRGERGD